MYALISHLFSPSASFFLMTCSQISPMSPHLPWMTVDGNHERDFPNSGSVWTGTDSGGECGVALAKRFHMPNPTSPAPPGLDQTWWSVDFGPVHFTVISTEHQFNVTSPQYDWIQQDLAKVDRTRTPFLLLAGHRSVLHPTNHSITVIHAVQQGMVRSLFPCFCCACWCVNCDRAVPCTSIQPTTLPWAVIPLWAISWRLLWSLSCRSIEWTRPSGDITTGQSMTTRHIPSPSAAHPRCLPVLTGHLTRRCDVMCLLCFVLC